METLKRRFAKQITIYIYLIFIPFFLFGLLTLFFQRNYLWILEIAVALWILYDFYLMLKYGISITGAPMPWLEKCVIYLSSEIKGKRSFIIKFLVNIILIIILEIYR